VDASHALDGADAASFCNHRDFLVSAEIVCHQPTSDGLSAIQERRQRGPRA
jgi:hypothetical protein